MRSGRLSGAQTDASRIDEAAIRARPMTTMLDDALEKMPHRDDGGARGSSRDIRALEHDLGREKGQ